MTSKRDSIKVFCDGFGVICIHSFTYLLLLMTYYMYVPHMANDVIKMLQGSGVTQTVLGLGELTIYPPANFSQCICAKNYENWLAVDKVIAKISRLTFWPTLYMVPLH